SLLVVSLVVGGVVGVVLAALEVGLGVVADRRSFAYGDSGPLQVGGDGLLGDRVVVAADEPQFDVAAGGHLAQLDQVHAEPGGGHMQRDQRRHRPPPALTIRATRLRSYTNRDSRSVPSWAATCWIASVRWMAFPLYFSSRSPYAVTSYRPAREVRGEWMVTVKP